MAAAPLLPGDTVRIRGERWRVTAAAGPASGSILHVRGCDAANAAAVAAFLLPAEHVERVPHPSTPRVVRPARWRQSVRGALAHAVPSFASLRTPARAQLAVLPFQLEPALALTSGAGVRLLIADEVGLGKTVQAGLIVAELLARRPDAHVLVVSPAGLREQWQAELLQRFDIASALLDSATLARAHAAVLAGGNPWTASPVSITSVDFVKRPEVIRSIETLVWDLVILDEAHQLAGQSDRGTAVRTLAERARALVMLTATPHSGRDEEFARLAGLGDIGGRFPLVVFRRTRRDAGLTESRRTAWLRVRTTPAEHEVHAALLSYAKAVWRSRGASEPAARLAMTVLTRRACSSAGALARSIERRIGLLTANWTTAASQIALPFGGGDDATVLALDAPGLADPEEERHVLKRILDLARAAALDESKPALLRRFLRRAREPAIVFTEYRDTLGILAAALSCFEPIALHGALTWSERREVVRQFTRGGARLLLATDAAGEGLNLHERCRLVVNLELPWTPLRLEQRVGRVERIGQHRPVHAVHLVAAGTTEEATVLTLLRRMHSVTAAVEAMRARPLHEQEVAAAVFEAETHDRTLAGRLKAAPTSAGFDVPALAVPASRPDVGAAFRRPIPPRLIVPDLRSAAAGEAARIARARALMPGMALTYRDRPLITRLRRGRTPFACCCIYRCCFVDANQQLIWETLIGVATSAGRAATATADALRTALTTTHHAVEPSLRAGHEAMLARFVAGQRAPARVAIARERAIMQCLIGHQSRMAANLVQRGLFDRRAERASAAQAVVLRSAVAACAARLRELANVEHAAAAGRELVYAVVSS
jgi:superfamily II DNA or RNA helicase